MKDAVKLLYDRYVKDDPEMQALIEEEKANALIARQIYELRTEAGLSQRELAKLVGTSAACICRLEDANYEGHSLALLNRVAEALGRKVVVTFPPCDESRVVH